jgi:hypothetical protein
LIFEIRLNHSSNRLIMLDIAQVNGIKHLLVKKGGRKDRFSFSWYIYIQGLLPFVQTPLGMHHILTKLFSLALSKLHSLYTTCLSTLTTDPYFTLYKLTAIILKHLLVKKGGRKDRFSFSFPRIATVLKST